MFIGRLFCGPLPFTGQWGTPVDLPVIGKHFTKQFVPLKSAQRRPIHLRAFNRSTKSWRPTLMAPKRQRQMPCSFIHYRTKNAKQASFRAFNPYLNIANSTPFRPLTCCHYVDPIGISRLNFISSTNPIHLLFVDRLLRISCYITRGKTCFHYPAYISPRNVRNCAPLYRFRTSAIPHLLLYSVFIHYIKYCHTF